MNQNEQQNFANHRRLHPLYHIVFILLTLVLTVLAVVEAVRSFHSEENRLPALLMLVVAALFIVVVLIIRSYPLKAQDRAIRAEENLRHFALTQKLLDPRLSIRQIAALRFASDEEFPALCRRASVEQLSPDAIKKAIEHWRADHYRI